MPSHVALLRGINLGPRNKVPMPDLRAAAEEIGLLAVSTYIASGNLLFDLPDGVPVAAVPDRLREAVRARTGVDTPVIVVSREELADAIAATPFPDQPDPKKVHAIFLAEPADDALRERVAAVAEALGDRVRADEARAVGRVLYLHTPDGLGRSDFAAKLTAAGSTRTPGIGGTARNWATVTKLLALCGPATN